MATAEITAALERALSGRSAVAVAILFGSVARRSSTAPSDVDVAILAPGVDLLSLAASLGEALCQEVDAVSLEDPAFALLEEILRDGVVVHESHRGRAAAWRARTLVTMETDRPLFRRMNEAWLARVAAKGF